MKNICDCFGSKFNNLDTGCLRRPIWLSGSPSLHTLHYISRLCVLDALIRSTSATTMSTFSGSLKEFPRLRIDNFHASDPPPLATLLSHVHTDHLRGLESFKSTFIFCSPATRDLLLRLEKYANRMNLAKGILEQRKRTFRHLKRLIKAIPLEVRTWIELGEGDGCWVTAFDANHCMYFLPT